MIVREHFIDGRPLTHLITRDPVALKAEIPGNRRRAITALNACAAALQKG